MEYKWWQKAVIYQIYPRSFQDTNGDGLGDIPGIIQRLDYLEDLGINAIWLSPVYQSPQDDNGYDISDYQNIDPIFGSLEDMNQLIAEAKKRDIRIIMDLVLNHCSDEHFWFQEALKGKENPYHDYFIWTDGEEGVLPNDMRSAFGGIPAWTWVPSLGQYYFHQFSRKQPDLNWENPKVREEIYSMINWWIDRGIEGFRLDVIDHIGKIPLQKVTVSGPMLHTYIKEMSQTTFGKAGLVSVGEAWSANIDTAPIFSNPDGSELSMVFQFEHIILDQNGHDKFDLSPLPFLKLKEVFHKWQTQLHGNGWNSLFWDNHDLPRIVSRWGNDSEEYRVISAKMLATVLHGMEGTPYIFQGEELGMTNTHFEIEELKDIEAINNYKDHIAMGWSEERIKDALNAKGRDNARTPMHWDDTDYAGFTNATPWIKINPNYTSINAASQVNDPDSVFSYYKTLIRFRKEIPVFVDGSFTMLLPENEEIFAYQRENETQKLIVLCNFYGNECVIDGDALIPEGSELILGNYKEIEKNILKPYEARMYLI